MSSPDTQHATALDLDRLVLERLPEPARARVLGHLGDCDRCAGAHRERIEGARHFARAVHARTAPAVVRRLTGWRGWLRSGRAAWLPVVAAAAIAGAILLARLPPASTTASGPVAIVTTPEPQLGIKGGGVLKVFARRGDGAVLVENGSTLAPGDQIRFVVQSSGLPYALLVSADGAGKQSVYLPHEGAASQAVPRDEPFEVPGSIVLDDAPGPERIWALFSRRPLRHSEVAAVVRALAARGPQALRAASTLEVPDTTQASVLFEKRRRGAP